MTAHVVIAARGGEDAKSRFGARLTAPQREALVEAMLSDMLDGLSGCSARPRVHVVTPTPGLARLASSRGAAVISDPGRGLNAAFASGREAVAKADPGGVIALLPGDLPLLESREADEILWLGRKAVVLVRAAADGGTGAIASPAATPLPLAFGPGSFQKHLRAARGLGIPTRVIDAPSLGFDMDRPEDMDALLQSGRNGAAAALLRRLGSAGETAA